MNIKKRFVQMDILPIYKYTLKNLNLRDGKSTSANIVTVIPKGTKVNTEVASGEVYAAIAMALAIHEDSVHDFEDTVLTMKKVEKRYSPWSSKVYNLRELPKKN